MDTSAPLKPNYDPERLREDPEYRQKVLDKMAAGTRSRWHYRRMILVLQLIIGVTLFATGLFLGGWLSWQQSIGATLLIVCLLLIPLMGWLLVTVRNYNQEKETSQLGISEQDGETTDSPDSGDDSPET